MGKNFSFYRALTTLEKLSTPALFALSAGLILVMGYLDYISGYELSFSLFYLIPVTIAAWGISLNAGLMISALSAITWVIANLLAGKSYTNDLIAIWNTLIRMGFFSITAMLINTLREVLQAERILARTDPLTSALNRRALHDILSAKLLQAQQTPVPCTLVYIDLDNFKTVNDSLGHASGDAVLKTVAQTAIQSIRSRDYFARLGGDEFAVYLPDTNTQVAKKVVERLNAALMTAMQKQHWPITFSMGVMIFSHPPKSANEMIEMADHLMYKVKAQGKSSICYAIDQIDET